MAKHPVALPIGGEVRRFRGFESMVDFRWENNHTMLPWWRPIRTIHADLRLIIERCECTIFTGVHVLPIRDAVLALRRSDYFMVELF